MRSFFKPFLLIVTLVSVACNNNKQPGENNTDEGMKKSNITTVEEANREIPRALSEFAVEMFVESMTEIELGRLALNRASMSGVKDLARVVVVDFTQFKKEISGLAKERSITLPIVMDKAHQRPYDNLKDLKDRSEFDPEFLDVLAENLDNAIDLLEDAEHIRDEEIQVFASTALLKIRQHKMRAEALKEGL